MKVLMQSRKTLFSDPGGDTVQILKTKQQLEKLGVQVDLSTELEADLGPYDLVHLFNLIRPQETFLQARNAKTQQKRVVLSPIYVVYGEYEKKGRGGLLKFLNRLLRAEDIEYFKVLARGLKNREIHKGTLILLARGYAAIQKKILRMSYFLLPNSDSERKRIVKDFGIPVPSYLIVPNGVDPELFGKEEVQIKKEFERFRGCVLCVARIEGRKNQLRVVRAMHDLPFPLVLVGKASPNHRAYLKKIMKESSENVFLLGERDPSDLAQLYHLAKVHVLASWFETTGLSSLEAAASGCNLVLSRRGDAWEYFGEDAHYCEPDSVDSIREAILRAHEEPVNSRLRENVFKNFTWAHAAAKTLEAYEKVLARGLM